MATKDKERELLEAAPAICCWVAPYDSLGGRAHAECATAAMQYVQKVRRYLRENREAE